MVRTPVDVASGVTVKSHLPSPMSVMFGISQKEPSRPAVVPVKKRSPLLLHSPDTGLYLCRVVVPTPFFELPTMIYASSPCRKK